MMRNLHIKDNLKKFLLDLHDFISLYDNCMYVYNYKKLKKLESTEIVINFEKFQIIVIGKDLMIKQMTKRELLINGVILKVEYVYD